MSEGYYCGPKGTPKILRSNYFEPACRVHDKDYKLGSEDRKKVDKRFYEAMLTIAETKLRKLQAYFLYKLVRMFGWIFYGK